MLKFLLGTLAPFAHTAAPALAQPAPAGQTPSQGDFVVKDFKFADGRTHGHGAHTWAINWKDRLAELLRESAK